jgi:periplasmic protein TonB
MTRAISSRRLVVAAFALVLAGCPSTEHKPTPTPTPVPPVVTPRPVPPPVATPAPSTPSDSNATTLDAYKRDLAQRIHQVHAARIFPGKPPEVLHAVVVLQMVVDANGTPSNVRVLRTPSYAQSEARDAVQSVYAAGPLPRPNARVLGRGRTIEFTESWLFRADGRYQIRSLALPQ